MNAGEIARRCADATDAYYSLWLGRPGLLPEQGAGVSLLCAAERNRTQPGFSRQFDVYALQRGERVTVSYGDRAAAWAAELRRAPHLSARGCIEEIARRFPRQTAHSIKFCLAALPAAGTARALGPDDAPAYFAFYQRAHPSSGNVDWLPAYFYGMVARRLCCGVFAEDVLVSCTDAPSMPYLPERVQEIGVNTLPEYRGRGYAAAACSLCARHILESGRCPQWSCGAENTASIRLAEKIGFRKYADVYTVSL